ncbi:MAG TPA: O-antigen ligase family protein [Tepidisphaeraceae bacterium]|jgi:O-antigen ligase/tetratricopeptide (TPR) repeat protein
MRINRLRIRGETLPLTRFDTTIEVLLYALLIFSPAALGVVQPWSEQLFVALCSAMTLCFTLKLIIHRHTRFVWSILYLPIALFAGLAVFQLVPLPSRFMRLFAGTGFMLRAQMQVDPAALDARLPLSFYTLATRHELWLVLCYVSVFIITINVFQRRDQIRRLLLAITSSAAAVISLALFQDFIGTDKILFTWLSPAGLATSGPFVNHSHFSQYVNLSIGCAIGLMLVRLREMTSLERFLPRSVNERLHLPEFRIIWLGAFVVVGGVGAIFLSGSRGGIFCATLAATFLAIALAGHQKLRAQGWLMMMLALICAAALSYFLLDAGYDRWIAARHVTSARDRWQVLRDALAAWRLSPVFGTGLGTNSVVLPMFDSTEASTVPTYADNDYAQTMIEMGLAGLIITLTFITLIWTRFTQAIRKTNSRTCAAAFGHGYGLLAVMIHSWSDYGQHIPAVATLTAISCALLVTLSKMKAMKETDAPVEEAPPPSIVSGLLRLAALGGVVFVSAFALAELNGSRRADAFAQHASAIASELEQNDWDATDAVYEDLIVAAESAADAQPADVSHRYWLNVYRWRSITRAPDRESGAMLMSPESREHARRIVEDLQITCALCPTFGYPDALAGQIQAFVLGDVESGAARIRSAHKLCPNHDIACFSHALIDALQGRVDESVANMQKAVRLNNALLDRAAAVYIRRVHRPELAVSLADGRVAWLLHVSDLLAEERADLRKVARRRAKELALAQCQQPGADADAFAIAAQLCAEHGELAAAVEHYRRALDADYGQVNWRVALCRCLARAGRAEEAAREARICLRLDPLASEARRVLEDVTPNVGL